MTKAKLSSAEWLSYKEIKNSVHTSEEKQCVSVTKTDRLNIFREISAVYSENNKKRINTVKWAKFIVYLR